MIERVLHTHREIVLVLMLFIALGGLYSVITPLFEAPDEPWHFAYVQHVASGRGLPVQSLDQPAHLARQEASQPPLYYLIAAAATLWIDTSDFPAILWENPHYGFAVPGVVNDNKNLFIHTALESFPYGGAVLAIHIARFVSVLSGALAVLFTYLLALRIFPDQKFLAAGAAAVAAFVPQFLFISGAVSNDSTITAMSALSLWLIVRMFFIQPQTRDAAALGVATGLAALAKVSGLGLVFLAALVTIYVVGKNSRRLVIQLSTLAIVFTLVAGWWYLRNWMLYGEFTGTEMMRSIFGARQTPLTFDQFNTQLNEVRETFWIGFGWGNVRAQPILYTAFDLLRAVSGIGIVVGLVRQRGERLPFFVLVLWTLLVIGELVRWMMLTQAPHGRLLFPALPALATLIVFGLTRWASARFQSIVAHGLGMAMFALAAIAPFTILEPAYAFPSPLSAAEAQNIAHRVDINYGHKIKLLGYAVSPRVARADGSIELMLYWQSLAAMDDDYSIGIALLDSNQHALASRNSYPGHGLLPTRLWHAGQMIRDSYWLPIPADAPAPSIAQIQISLFSRAFTRNLPAFDPNDQAITPIVGRFKIGSARPSEVRAQNSTAYIFGKQIALVGYDLHSNPSLDLTLYWKRLAPVSNDYTVFVHILDANDKIIAQKDQEPANGSNPTSFWDDGEIVVDSHSFNLPADARGAYRIQVGLYRADTGMRLSIMDAKENTLGDHVILASFEVGQ